MYERQSGIVISKGGHIENMLVTGIYVALGTKKTFLEAQNLIYFKSYDCL